MNDVEVLEQARELIASENSWCRGTVERETPVPVGGVFRWRKVMVTQHCAWGALQAVMGVDATHDHRATEVAGATKFLAAAVPPQVPPQVISSLFRMRDSNYDRITVYNDHHTHDQVLKVFDRAIALARAKEEEKIKVAQYVTAADRDLAVSGD